jgi:hypothetical protein
VLKPEKFGWQGSESKSTQWTQIVFEGVFLNLRPFEFPTVADYSPITVKNFVTMYTAFNPCNRGNLLLKLQEKV